jgi:hypothetical protein
MDDLNLRAKVSKGYERDRVFLNALLSNGKRIFDALVLDLDEDDGSVKICLWIPEWQQRAKCSYVLVEKQEDKYIVCSADESQTHELKEGCGVRIQCGLNTGAKRWKDRLLVSIV